MPSQNPAAIILAAGEASRFGSPKQLIRYRGKTLVERATKACLDAGAKQVVVVTGAYQQEVTKALQMLIANPAVTLAQNANWALGMHTSIACGMKALLEKATDFDAVFVMLVDQPLIDAPFLRKLATALSDADAAALSYPSGAGVPACFSKSLFSRLLNLTTQGGGAKGILRDPNVKTVTISAPNRRRDIDTLADWNDFNKL